MKQPLAKYGLMITDPQKAQAAYRALGAASERLMAAGAISTDPGNFAKNIAGVGSAFTGGYQADIDRILKRQLQGTQMHRMAGQIEDEEAARDTAKKSAERYAEQRTKYNMPYASPGQLDTYLGELAKRPNQKPVPTIVKDASGKDILVFRKPHEIAAENAKAGKDLLRPPPQHRPRDPFGVEVLGADDKWVPQMMNQSQYDAALKSGQRVRKQFAPKIATTGSDTTMVSGYGDEIRRIGDSPAQTEINLMTDTPLPPSEAKAVRALKEDLVLFDQNELLYSNMDNVVASVPLSPANNALYLAQKATGRLSPEGRKYVNMVADLQKMRNASLRLNKGVQTEGDAQRAWDELFSNLTDGKLITERLAQIRRLDAISRASKIEQINDVMRAYRKPDYKPGANRNVIRIDLNGDPVD